MRRLRTIGGLHWEDDPTPIRLRTRKTETLLAWLAGSPRGLARDLILETLWPEEPVEAARQKLRLALTSLRGHLGDAVVADRTQVRLDGVGADWTEDPPPEGVFLPGYEGAWVEEVRGRLVRRRAQRLRQEAASDGDPGDLSATILLHERLLENDPFDEDAHRELYRLLKRASRRAAAERQRTRMRDLLGIDAPTSDAFHETPDDLPPLPTTPFFGREIELETLRRRLLGDEEPVWVTLHGPGGIGKTRLARELVRSAPEADVRAVWVSLADITEGERALRRVLNTLFPQGRGDPSLIPPTLLVLDNLEQIADVSPLATLLVPGLSFRVLATSQCLLEIPGAHAVTLEPLPIETGGASVASPAGRMLRARARARTGVEPSEANVGAILRQTGGDPLAIELAADALDMMDGAKLGKALATSLLAMHAPSGGDSERPARHTSLRAAVGWSLSLLDAETRADFAKLTAAKAAFSPEAASAILGRDATDFLRALAARSLISRVPGPFPRFEIPRSIAEALEGEIEDAAHTDAKEALYRHGIELGIFADKRPAEELPLLEDDIPLIRASIERAVTRGEVEDAGRAMLGLSQIAINLAPWRVEPDLFDRVRKGLSSPAHAILSGRVAMQFCRLAQVRDEPDELARAQIATPDAIASRLPADASPEDREKAELLERWFRDGRPHLLRREGRYEEALAAYEPLLDHESVHPLHRAHLRSGASDVLEALGRDSEADTMRSEAMAEFLRLDGDPPSWALATLKREGHRWGRDLPADPAAVRRAEQIFMEYGERFRRPEVLYRHIWLGHDGRDANLTRLEELTRLIAASGRPRDVARLAAVGAWLHTDPEDQSLLAAAALRWGQREYEIPNRARDRETRHLTELAGRLPSAPAIAATLGVRDLLKKLPRA